jgi:hypothetical protein
VTGVALVLRISSTTIITARQIRIRAIIPFIKVSAVAVIATIHSIGTLFHKEEINRYSAAENTERDELRWKSWLKITGGFSIFPENKASMEQAVTNFRSMIRNQYSFT